MLSEKKKKELRKARNEKKLLNQIVINGVRNDMQNARGRITTSTNLLIHFVAKPFNLCKCCVISISLEMYKSHLDRRYGR